MKHRSQLIALLALLVVMAIPASANIAPPDMGRKPPKRTNNVASRMLISPDAEAKEAKLVIPRQLLQQLKAELDGEDSQTTAAAVTNDITLSPAQVAVAGLFMSLSLVLGGVWLVGSRAGGRRASRAAVVLAFVSLGGIAGATAAYANAGPPPVARSLTSKILIRDLSFWGASGAVRVEITNNDSEIKLVLPKPKEEATDGE